MKVNNVQVYNNAYLSNKESKKSLKKAPAFKGALAVNFWDAVARGGFAASFTIQDMTGTNFPRTYQALQRNKEITGQNNYKAAAEVAIREFMTGPSMCLIPMLTLAASKKIAGASNEVPLENIETFSDQMKGILQNSPMNIDSKAPAEYIQKYSKQVKSDFYEKMFALSLGENVQEGAQVSDRAKELAGMLKQYDAAPKRGFFRQLLNQDIIKHGENGAETVKIKAKDQILNDIITKFTNTKKHLTDNYTELLSTDLNGTLKSKKPVTSLIKEFSIFGGDVEKTIIKRASGGKLNSPGVSFTSFMDEFKTRRVGSKFITNVLMVVTTALFMINIPKLYTLYETNPETDAFRGYNKNKSAGVKDASK